MTFRFRRYDARIDGLWTAICLLCLLSALGCRTGSIRAAKLPPQFRVPPVTNSEVMNLAGIIGPGVHSSLIGPGDLLQITVASGIEDEDSQPRQARVAADGSVKVPLIGPVRVAGLEPFEASQQVAAEAMQRGIFVDPHVVVEIQRKAVNRVKVVGAVAEPGFHEIPRGSSELLTAIAAAGGFTEEAGSEVEIVRQPRMSVAAESAGGVQLAAYHDTFSPPAHESLAQNASADAQIPTSDTPRTVKIDLSAQRQFSPADYQVRDGDTIRVLQKDKRIIHVTGLVRLPGQFELPKNDDVYLIGAIAQAGGLSNPVADKVLVIRRLENRAEPVVIQASWSKAKQNGRENIRLQNGDMVSVEQTAATMLVDTVTNFVRFSFGVAGRTTSF